MVKNDRRFDSPEYVENANKGVFPKIHQDVALLVREYADDPEPAIDLGASTGILALQMLRLGRSRVLAVEPKASSREAGVYDPNLIWIPMMIKTEADVAYVGELCSDHGVTLCMARRVLSEVGESGGVEAVEFLGRELYDAGVKYIIVEGRVEIKNPTAKLWKGALEIEALQKHAPWRLNAKRGQASLLWRGR